MKILSMVKSIGNSGPPPAALMEAMDTFVKEAVDAGVLVSTGGLGPPAEGLFLRLEGGKLHIKDGPFAETKEVIGGYAIMEVASREEALDWGRRFMALHETHWPEWHGESEMREMQEAPLPARV